MRVRVRGAACTYSSPAICSSESRAQETNATVRVSSLWSGATPSATARAPLLHAPPPSNADISYPAILAEWCTYLLNSLNAESRAPVGRGRGLEMPGKPLLHVCRDEFRHLKHRYLAFAAEKRLQLVVRQDIALVGGILKVIGLDVDPNLLHDPAAGHRALAYNRLQLGSKVERL